MKVVSRIITGVVIAAAVAALGICSYMSTKVKYNAEGYIAVSYTHLTLPTICSV